MPAFGAMGRRMFLHAGLCREGPHRRWRPTRAEGQTLRGRRYWLFLGCLQMFMLEELQAGGGEGVSSGRASNRGMMADVGHLPDDAGERDWRRLANIALGKTLDAVFILEIFCFEDFHP